jgi:hypothetical protein
METERKMYSESYPNKYILEELCRIKSRCDINSMFIVYLYDCFQY